MATATKKKMTNSQPKNRLAEVATKAKKKAESDGDSRIIIQALNIGRLKVKLRGLSPLVVHNFDDKSKQQMLEKQTRKQKTAGRESRCPEEEFLNAIYWYEGFTRPEPKVNMETGERTYDPGVVKKAVEEAQKKGGFVLPAAGFKNAAVSAGRNADIPMTRLKQALFINGVGDPDWCVIDSPRGPKIDARICRIDNGRTPMERFRPKWEEWSTEVYIEFDKGLLSADNVVNLVNISGFFVGVFEGRPERSALGWGRYQVQDVK